jgi:hypothetical protein
LGVGLAKSLISNVFRSFFKKEQQLNQQQFLSGP